MYVDGSVHDTGGYVHSVRLHGLEQCLRGARSLYDKSAVQYSMEGANEGEEQAWTTADDDDDV